ncbi:MAG: hypothetical protein ACRDI1_06760 [Actinomycetota bacterium]
MQRLNSKALFARWFWVVYVPLGLLAGLLVLLAAGFLPSWGVWILAAFGAWSLLAVVLLFERRRRGLSVPPPKSIVKGTAWVAALAAAGSLFGWLGTGRLTSDTGVVMALVGAFLVTFAVLAPALKIVDLLLRRLGRMLLRGRGESPAPGIETESVAPTREPEPASAKARWDERYSGYARAWMEARRTGTASPKIEPERRAPAPVRAQRTPSRPPRQAPGRIAAPERKAAGEYEYRRDREPARESSSRER